MDEPQPGLRVGQRNSVRSTARGQWRPSDTAFREPRHQFRDRRRFEEHPDRRFGAERGPDACHDTGHRQGITPELEEVVVDADTIHGQMQDVREHAHKGSFQPGARGTMARTVPVGGRQRGTVEFAVGRDRHGRQRHHHGRDHEIRKLRRERVTNRGGVRDRSDARHHIRHHPVGSGFAPNHRRGLFDAGVSEQCRLHLTEFDAAPSHLDLEVGAPRVGQAQVRDDLRATLVAHGPAHEIAGSVHPRPGRPERIRDEPRRRRSRSSVVAARHRRSRRIELSDHPGRYRMQPRVEHDRAEPSRERLR